MSLRYYFDVQVRRAVSDGLRMRGTDVLTAVDDGRRRLEDPSLVDRATELGRVMFTHDPDFLTIAAERQRADQHFSGIIFAHQLRVGIGQCVRDLELLAVAFDSADTWDRVVYLPLR